MNMPLLNTERLILRKFTEQEIEPLYLLLKDEEVNRFLPWFPLKSMEEAESFFEERFSANDRNPCAYCYAVCLKQDNYPIGYVKAAMDDSYDFGYALRKEFWHQGIITEAGRAVVKQLKADGIPYITATHDIQNPRSGSVMKQLGMKYQYSYQEQWQPKNIPVTFRMYQLNLDGQEDRVYRKYWEKYSIHFVELNI